MNYYDEYLESEDLKHFSNYEIQTYETHPLFNIKTHENDITLIKTMGNIYWDYAITPICIANEFQDISLTNVKVLWFFMRNHLDELNDKSTLEDFATVAEILNKSDPRCSRRVRVLDDPNFREFQDIKVTL